MFVFFTILLLWFVFKENNCSREYAGISGDSIALYAEQTTVENVTEEACDRLAEDINYKLRQIIHVSHN